MKLPTVDTKAPVFVFLFSAPQGADEYEKPPNDGMLYVVPYMYEAMNHGYGENEGVIEGVGVPDGVRLAVCVGVTPKELLDVCDGATVPVAVRVAVMAAVVDAVAVADAVFERVGVIERVAVAVAVGGTVAMTSV